MLVKNILQHQQIVRSLFRDSNRRVLDGAIYELTDDVKVIKTFKIYRKHNKLGDSVELQIFNDNVIDYGDINVSIVKKPWIEATRASKNYVIKIHIDGSITDDVSREMQVAGALSQGAMNCIQSISFSQDLNPTFNAKRDHVYAILIPFAYRIPIVKIFELKEDLDDMSTDEYLMLLDPNTEYTALTNTLYSTIYESSTQIITYAQSYKMQTPNPFTLYLIDNKSDNPSIYHDELQMEVESPHHYTFLNNITGISGDITETHQSRNSRNIENNSSARYIVKLSVGGEELVSYICDAHGIPLDITDSQNHTAYTENGFEYTNEVEYMGTRYEVWMVFDDIGITNAEMHIHTKDTSRCIYHIERKVNQSENTMMTLVSKEYRVYEELVPEQYREYVIDYIKYMYTEYKGWDHNNTQDEVQTIPLANFGNPIYTLPGLSVWDTKKQYLIFSVFGVPMIVTNTNVM